MLNAKCYIHIYLYATCGLGSTPGSSDQAQLHALKLRQLSPEYQRPCPTASARRHPGRILLRSGGCKHSNPTLDQRLSFHWVWTTGGLLATAKAAAHDVLRIKLPHNWSIKPPPFHPPLTQACRAPDASKQFCFFGGHDERI